METWSFRFGFGRKADKLALVVKSKVKPGYSNSQGWKNLEKSSKEGCGFVVVDDDDDDDYAL
jgi:hypothetical protein